MPAIDRQLPPTLIRLLEFALSKGATDVLVAANRPPTMRVAGTLVLVHDVPPFTSVGMADMVYDLVGEPGTRQLEEQRDRDFSFELPGLGRFRGSFYYQRGDLALALRVLPAVIPTIEELDLPASVSQLALLPRGLVLVTGPTGSGKSTTLAAMINVINQTAAKHIITIEDPIEFVHTDKQSRVEQRELEVDTPSFSRALRGVFRQNPDVVLVGEMRDAETIQIVLSLAETGHLTLATLHTNSCANTIHRMIDVFSEDRQVQIRSQLSLSLEGVVSLALVPRVGGGLVLATEILIVTPAVRAMIREGRAHHIYSAMQSGKPAGMRTMNQSLASLVMRGLITLDDACAKSSEVKELRQLIGPSAATR